MTGRVQAQVPVAGRELEVADDTAVGREQAGIVAGDPDTSHDSVAAVIDRDLPAGDERLDAFISYARRPGDREFVDWLSSELTGRDKQVWLDRTSIEPARLLRTITSGSSRSCSAPFRPIPCLPP